MIKQIDRLFEQFNRNSKLQYLLLAGIMLLAAVLRFYRLGDWSFWTDELATVTQSQNIFYIFFNNTTRFIHYHPTTSLLISAPLTLFGTTEWTARLAPAIIGVLTILILYFPVKKIFNSNVAFFVGLLIAISPWHIYWSQTARYQILLALFYTLTLLTFYIGVETNRRYFLLISIVFAGLTITERLLGFYLFPVIIGYLVLVKIIPFGDSSEIRWRNLAFIMVPLLLLAVIVTWRYIQDPGLWIATFVGRSDKGFVEIARQFIYSIGAGTIVLALLGAVYLLLQKQKAALLIGLGAVVPPIVTVSASLVQYSDVRYAFISVAVWLILAAAGAVALISQTRDNAKIIALGTSAFLLLLSPLRSNMQYYKTPNRDTLNWKTAFQIVEEKNSPDDLVVTNKPEMAEYYLKENVIGMKEVDPRLEPATLAKEQTRAWFVIGGLSRLDPTLHEWVLENCQLVSNIDNNSFMNVYLYDPANSLNVLSAEE